jgi:transcription elongation factor Elf1
MVFRCPTCGRFIKTESEENDVHIGTCKKCNLAYKARFDGCITESGDYEASLTVWPAVKGCGKWGSWHLRGDW